MAFRLNSDSNNSNNAQSNKTDAYINIYLPTKDGSRTKLGVLALSNSKPLEKQLIEFIKGAESVEKAIAMVSEKLVMDFYEANANASRELDLG